MRGQGEQNMTIQIKSERAAALTIGLALLIMAIAAGLAYGAIHSSLIDMSRPEETSMNLSQNSSNFMIEIVLWVVIILTDLLVSWGVWLYFKEKNRRLSLRAAALRLIYTLFLIGAVSQLMAALPEAQTGSSERVLVQLSRFDRIWSLGLIVFGFHLILLAIETFRYENRFIGILLLAAGISYALVHALYNFLPQLDTFNAGLESALAIPMTAGEMLFALWMIFRFFKGKKKDVS